MQNSVHVLLNSAMASLAIDISGPGLPALAFWAARTLVSRWASRRAPQLHERVELGGRALDRPAAPSRCRRPRRSTPLRRDAAAARTDGRALVHQRGQRHAPALAHVADALRVGDPCVGHVDLVELGLAGDLAQRTHLDARRAHVEREVGHALVLGRLGVGAGDEHAPVGQVGHGVPHLLAVDDPLVAVAHRPGAQTGEVAAGARLAEQLAPALLAGEHRAQEAALLLVGAVGDDRRAGQRHEEARRQVGSGRPPCARRTRPACSAPAAPRARRSPPGSGPRPGRRRNGRRGTPVVHLRRVVGAEQVVERGLDTGGRRVSGGGDGRHGPRMSASAVSFQPDWVFPFRPRVVTLQCSAGADPAGSDHDHRGDRRTHPPLCRCGVPA